MAHYAEIGLDNVVKRVLAVDTIQCMTPGGIEREEIGQAHLEEHHGGTWIKCSYNTVNGVHHNSGTPFRGNFPGKGWIYNSEHDIFHTPKPPGCDSWTLNTTTGIWEHPSTAGDIPVLDYDAKQSGQYYEWDESAYQADNTTGWVLRTRS